MLYDTIQYYSISFDDVDRQRKGMKVEKETSPIRQMEREKESEKRAQPARFRSRSVLKENLEKEAFDKAEK